MEIIADGRERTPEEKYSIMSGEAQDAYRAAMDSADWTALQLPRFPLLWPGAFAERIGYETTPQGMTHCLANWLVVRLAYLVQCEDGQSYIEIEAVDYAQAGTGES